VRKSGHFEIKINKDIAHNNKMIAMYARKLVSKDGREFGRTLGRAESMTSSELLRIRISFIVKWLARVEFVKILLKGADWVTASSAEGLGEISHGANR
jgi:hypothetical protein